LKYVKDANPLELAEYAKLNGIVEQPAFTWWVPEIISKRNRIINKVKTKYWHTSHKFGIEIPKSVEHALRIDQETGTDHWQCAIEKEMKNVHIAVRLILYLLYTCKCLLSRNCELITELN